MSEEKKNNWIAGWSRKQIKIAGAAAIAVSVIVLLVVIKVVQADESPVSKMVTFAAKRGPLTISVLESGTIKSREQIIIKNEVEGRTSIISLIQEGTRVKKGDLLVELDASILQDTKIDQEIMVQNAEAAHINAVETLAVVENQAQSDIDVAELTFTFAKQDLDQYKAGLYPNELKTAETQVTISGEELLRAEDTYEKSKRLYDVNYLAESELLANELAVTKATLSLELRESDLAVLKEFTYRRQIDQFESDLKQSEMALERAKRKANADIVQARSDLNAKKAEFDRQTTKLEKLNDQIVKAKVYAPADGMAIYATTAKRGGFRDNRTPLDEGVEVFERQELIYLPTATSAMVEVDIHEASLDKVQLGLPAIITVDALPGKKFVGTMARIAPLPDPTSMWLNPDLKVYESDIYLDGEDPSLRTGMSCKAEIIAAQYDDVVYIPVQAVIRVGGKPSVYVVKDGRMEERLVEIGLDNNRMIRIVSGIEEGEIVLLTPPLRSAAMDSASVAGARESVGEGSSDSLLDRINERLDEVNSVPIPKPDAGVQAGPGGPGQGPGGASAEQMRKRFENMSDEERKKAMERFQNMSEEDRQKMRQQMQGAGGRPGAGPGQGGPGGQRQGGARPPGAAPRGGGRNQ